MGQHGSKVGCVRQQHRLRQAIVCGARGSGIDFEKSDRREQVAKGTKMREFGGGNGGQRRAGCAVQRQLARSAALVWAILTEFQRRAVLGS